MAADGTSEKWNCLSFFTAAAVLHLLGCALGVGVRRKVLWLVLGLFLLMVANPLGMSEALIRDTLGLDTLLSGGLAWLAAWRHR